MRIAERALGDDPPVLQQPGDRMEHRDLQRFGGRERRQQAGQATRKHRLARARRADQQKIMATRRGHFERPAGGFLAFDVGEVGQPRACLGHARRRSRQHLRALEMVDYGDEGRRCDDVAGARPRRLAATGLGTDDTPAAATGRDGRRQDARDRP